ncbi:MAG: hypothetical protein VW831_14695 [Gammaproteobacteria bacterium]
MGMCVMAMHQEQTRVAGLAPGQVVNISLVDLYGAGFRWRLNRIPEPLGRRVSRIVCHG